MTPTDMWTRQNRRSLLLICCQVVVVVVLLLVAVPLADKVFGVWRDIANPGATLTESELNGQIAFWTSSNAKLQSQLDRIVATAEEYGHEEKQLALLQSTVAGCKLNLISCDLQDARGEDAAQGRTYSLQLRGAFRDFGKLISRLERAPVSVEVEQVSLERSRSGSAALDGNVVLSIGTGQ